MILINSRKMDLIRDNQTIDEDTLKWIDTLPPGYKVNAHFIEADVNIIRSDFVEKLNRLWFITELGKFGKDRLDVACLSLCLFNQIRVSICKNDLQTYADQMTLNTIREAAMRLKRMHNHTVILVV